MDLDAQVACTDLARGDMQGLICQGVTCSSLRLGWSPPEQLGQPPMHKYKLERQLQLPPDGSSALAGNTLLQERWATAHGELDDEDLQWQDSGLQVLHANS